MKEILSDHAENIWCTDINVLHLVFIFKEHLISEYIMHANFNNMKIFEWNANKHCCNHYYLQAILHQLTQALKNKTVLSGKRVRYLVRCRLLTVVYGLLRQPY